MAKIKFGMMMTDARGKLGGQVFSKNRGGAYVRTKVTPGNPQTVFQSIVRGLFAVISAGWSALTEAQRAAWNGAVEDWQTTDVFGDNQKPSGKNLHQRLNQNALAVEYPELLTPPAKMELPNRPLTKWDINVGSGDIMEPEDFESSSNAKAIIYATPPLSQGTRFVKNRLRQIYYAQGNQYSNQDAYDAYVARFGEPAVGDNIYLGIKYVVASGQTSPLQTIKADIIDEP